jgi:DNA-directed RNA polymerase specialized sigma24 family protein
MTTHSAARESTIPLQANWNADESGQAVIGQAQKGDVDAFELIYNEHSGRVYALCLRLMGGEQTAAAELMQDVFIRAWKNLDRFRGESAFSSWLHRLAVNAMLENARSDKRRTARGGEGQSFRRPFLHRVEVEERLGVVRFRIIELKREPVSVTRHVPPAR